MKRIAAGDFSFNLQEPMRFTEFLAEEGID